jgi:hypothetical protein
MALQGAPQQAPGIDVGGLARAIGEAFGQAMQTVLSGWANQLPTQIGTEGQDLVHSFLDWFGDAGINFVFSTPMALVTVGAGITNMADVRLLLGDLTRVALVLAALSYCGTYFFGWPGMGEQVGRIVTTIILVGVTWRLMDLSVQVEVGMLSVFAPRMPSLPNLGTLNPFISFGAILTWLFLFLRLCLQMAKRMVWLATLYPFGPIATATRMRKESAWVATLFWKLWVGWLFGQPLVVACIAVALAMLGQIGGPGGYLLSLGALLVGYDVVYVMAPKDGGYSVNVGVGPAKLSL